MDNKIQDLISQTILCGDAAEVLKNFPDISIDAIITSPPYDNLRDYKGFNFAFNDIAKELYRVLKVGGVIVWIVGDAAINGGETLTSFRQALYFQEIGFKVHDTMIYQKNNFSNPSKNRYHQIFEFMFILSKGSPKT
ncbi:MAG: site-specific DNA-methyltransferase, partial [Elusimicrobiota bacterium]|nr:site-specific DNA-methyltransferase [Elusimicrobiota bacterium]